LTSNTYKLDKDKLDLYLKYQDKSFFSMLEQNSQIYTVPLNKNDFTDKLYTISLHYFQKDESLKKNYKKYILPQKTVIKNSKKIVLKGLGDFQGEDYKTLIIHLNIK